MLRALWGTDEPLSAAEIRAALPDPQPASTTVLTVLDRLVDKGEVIRSGPSVRRQRFTTTRSERAYTSDAMHAALRNASDREAALLRFAGDLDDADVALLQRALGGD